jgi:hypothetical protein
MPLLYIPLTPKKHVTKEEEPSIDKRNENETEMVVSKSLPRAPPRDTAVRQ